MKMQSVEYTVIAGIHGNERGWRFAQKTLQDAASLLDLSTQVPTRAMYLTDGRRKIPSFLTN